MEVSGQPDAPLSSHWIVGWRWRRQSRSGCSDEEESPSFCRELNPGRPAPSLVILIELPRLNGSYILARLPAILNEVILRFTQSLRNARGHFNIALPHEIKYTQISLKHLKLTRVYGAAIRAVTAQSV
jgi:hypothetical protein